MKWSKKVDERVFRYQVETGKMSMDGDNLPKDLIEDLKIAAKKIGAPCPYYSESGVDYVYKFCPTSVGLITKVKNSKYRRN